MYERFARCITFDTKSEKPAKFALVFFVLPKIDRGKMLEDTSRLQSVEPSKTLNQSMETISSNQCTKQAAAVGQKMATKGD